MFETFGFKKMVFWTFLNLFRNCLGSFFEHCFLALNGQLSRGVFSAVKFYKWALLWSVQQFFSFDLPM